MACVETGLAVCLAELEQKNFLITIGQALRTITESFVVL